MGTFKQEKEKNATKQYAYQYYLNKGYRPIEAAAIVGNLDIESAGFSPDVVSGKRTGDNGSAFGIAQWRLDRQDILNSRENPKSLDTQLEYVHWELNNTHKSALAKMRQANTVEQATEAFTWEYERPNKQLAHLDKRINSAAEILGATPGYKRPETPTMESRPGGLQTSSTVYQEPQEEKVSQAKQDIAEKSFIEDIKNALAAQQEQINALATPAEEEPQFEQFTSDDMQDPYNYIALDPGLNLEEMQEGGIIDDPRGQWAYPGKITRIPSNRITMKGVPYPVLGVDDLGNSQMMYPNGEYKFKGRFVTEYPQNK